jgi:hypothetical protein
MKINAKKYHCRAFILKKTIEKQYIYSTIEDSEAVLVSERNNVGFQTPSSFV